MKKFAFLAIIIGSCMVNSIFAREIKDSPTKEDQKVLSKEEIPMSCTGVGIYIWCTGEMIHDTACWGGNTGLTYQEAMNCEGEIGAVLNNEICCSSEPGH